MEEQKKKVLVFGAQTIDEKAIAETLEMVGEGNLEVKTMIDEEKRILPKGFDAYVISQVSLDYFSLEEQLRKTKKENPDSRLYLIHTSEKLNEDLFDRRYSFIRTEEAEEIRDDLYLRKNGKLPKKL